MQSWPIVPLSAEQLNERANPPKSEGPGVSEAVAWVAYDTVTYLTGVDVRIQWFQTVKNTPQLSNMELAGAFPSPQFFEVWGISLDVLTPPQAGALSAVLDVWSVLFGTGTAGQGAPSVAMKVSQKEQFRIPLSCLHGTGGPLGFGWSQAASVAAGSAEWANNSVPDGGFPLSGSIMIPPTVGFSLIADWDAVVALSASRGLRASMHGTLHRRIL